MGIIASHLDLTSAWLEHQALSSLHTTVGEDRRQPVVREHGPADRCAGGDDRVAGGRWHQQNQADLGWGPERCFAKWLKRSKFPISVFFCRAAELASSGANRRGFAA